MNKVLLVNTNVEKAPYPVPPLGICMLAAHLEGQYRVKVYDGMFDEGRSLVSMVMDFNPDYIGFSIRNIDDVVKDRIIFYPDGILEKFIRPVRAVTGATVILGGSGFSIFPVELMKMTGAAYGIVGEAEEILPELLKRIENKGNADDLPGVITSETLTVFRGKRHAARNSMDDRFPEMDRRIDFSGYLPKGSYSIQTKRGCSHRCIYCTYPVIEGKTFRPRNPSDIADEIEQAHRRLGYVTFEFVDSTFNDPAGHAEAICREIIKRKIRIRLRTMGINPKNAGEELFRLMMAAGFVQIDATPDSASPRMLRNLQKGFSLQDVQRMAELIRRYDLPAMWFFLFGGPGEDETTFRETIDFIDSYVSHADLVYMNSGLRIYPGTPLYRTAVREGRITAGQSVFTPPAYYISDRISMERLDALIAAASSVRNNCVPANVTAPSPAMIAEAIGIREREQKDEPMFRTLLRVRMKWREEGKL